MLGLDGADSEFFSPLALSIGGAGFGTITLGGCGPLSDLLLCCGPLIRVSNAGEVQRGLFSGDHIRGTSDILRLKEVPQIRRLDLSVESRGLRTLPGGLSKGQKQRQHRNHQRHSLIGDRDTTEAAAVVLVVLDLMLHLVLHRVYAATHITPLSSYVAPVLGGPLTGRFRRRYHPGVAGVGAGE